MRIVDIGARTIALYIVARRTTVCIIVRQAPVTEQSLSEQHMLRILRARRRNWRDRLLAGAGLKGRRLSTRRRNRAKANERQQEKCDFASSYDCCHRGRRG